VDQKSRRPECDFQCTDAAGLVTSSLCQRLCFEATRERTAAAAATATTTAATILNPLNGLFSRTTWVSRYQKGKTNLDFTEARDDGDDFRNRLLHLHSFLSQLPKAQMGPARKKLQVQSVRVLCKSAHTVVIT